MVKWLNVLHHSYYLNIHPRTIYTCFKEKGLIHRPLSVRESSSFQAVHQKVRQFSQYISLSSFSFTQKAENSFLYRSSVIYHAVHIHQSKAKTMCHALKSNQHSTVYNRTTEGKTRSMIANYDFLNDEKEKMNRFRDHKFNSKISFYQEKKKEKNHTQRKALPQESIQIN